MPLTSKSEFNRPLHAQLDSALGEALHARLLVMAGIASAIDMLVSEPRVKDIARRCWVASECLDRPIVMFAGAVAHGERVRRK
ncbi:hypothetical protein [Burkholderia vietnamiensis]|uniref:hypothetical protein n=1 Tax=Burkholderia vietnamiensis TaxID=60552 RepID=UPI0011B2455E|nr:hypothetical protein [Burkholderia vietnamiensis]